MDNFYHFVIDVLEKQGITIFAPQFLSPVNPVHVYRRDVDQVSKSDLLIAEVSHASLGVGMGLALNTDRKVIVIAGDGDVLMSLSTLVLMNKLKLPNLSLYILDNGCFESTGGQKTCSDAVDFTKICNHNCKVMKVEVTSSKIPRIDMPHKEVMKRFYNEINKR